MLQAVRRDVGTLRVVDRAVRRLDVASTQGDGTSCQSEQHGLFGIVAFQHFVDANWEVGSEILEPAVQHGFSSLRIHLYRPEGLAE